MPTTSHRGGGARGAIISPRNMRKMVVSIFEEHANTNVLAVPKPRKGKKSSRSNGPHRISYVTIRCGVLHVLGFATRPMLISTIPTKAIAVLRDMQREIIQRLGTHIGRIYFAGSLCRPKPQNLSFWEGETVSSTWLCTTCDPPIRLDSHSIVSSSFNIHTPTCCHELTLRRGGTFASTRPDENNLRPIFPQECRWAGSSCCRAVLGSRAYTLWYNPCSPPPQNETEGQSGIAGESEQDIEGRNSNTSEIIRSLNKRSQNRGCEKVRVSSLLYEGSCSIRRGGCPGQECDREWGSGLCRWFSCERHKFRRC